MKEGDIFDRCAVGADKEVAQILSDTSIDIHKQDPHGWTLLAVAAKHGKHAVARRLVDLGANVNQTNKHDGSTPLFWASKEGDVSMVKVLLSSDANPSIALKNGLTPLLVAAREGRDDVVKVLLDKDVEVDQRDKHQRTALHYACYTEPRSTAQLLLDRGATNAKDKDGITPFHSACRQKWEDIVDILLEQIVADGDTELLHTKDLFGRLPIHYMVTLQFERDKKRWREPEHPSKFCLLSALFALEKKNLKLLNTYPLGACFLVRDPYGHLPANQAVRMGSDHCIEMLTLADETNEIARHTGDTGYLPLHRALTVSYQISKRASIVEFLLKAKNEHGFDDQLHHAKILESVATPDPKGYLPLHLALTFSPSKKIIHLLLKADAQGQGTAISTPGPAGFLPLHMALVDEDVDHEIVEMLIDYDTTGETVLTREPKSGKLPIHYAFDTSLPSYEQLKVLVDGDWERKSIYMRDGQGSIALHYLLQLKIDEKDKKDVAPLVELLLSESEKQTFGQDYVSKDSYSPLVAIVDRKTGMLPLHMAFKNSAPNEVIRLLLKYENSAERHTSPSLSLDTKSGKLPLHYACENNSTDPEIIHELLAHSEPETIAVKDKHNKYPLQYALKLQHADADLLNELLPGPATGTNELSAERDLQLKESNEQLETYNVNRDADFKAIFEEEVEDKNIFHGIANIEAYEWLYQMCQKENISKSTVNEAITEKLDSQVTIDWLNKKSSDRWSVGLLMSDVYVHCTWIALFINASSRYLANLYNGDDQPYTSYGGFLLLLASYFLFFREGIEFSGNTTFGTYLKDPWNWFENTTIICVIISSIHFLSKPGSEKHIEPLLITTGLLQFAFLTSFLRTTFLAYAQFVGGIVNIFKELIPFFLVTGIILLAFAYAYFVQRFKDNEFTDEFDTFGESFLTIFGAFVSGPERPETLVDILFGIISVVILLNVVIAIVSNAWDDSTLETTNMFWEYRINFIEEVVYTKEVLSKLLGRDIFWRRRDESDKKGTKRGVGEATNRPKPGSESEARIPSSQNSVLFHVKDHLTNPDNVVKEELGGLERSWFVVAYVLLFGLGLCSFGQLWPKRIRKDVFGRNKGTATVKEETLNKKFESPADINTITSAGRSRNDIHKSLQKIDDTKLEERIAKLEVNMQNMDAKLGNVQDLLQQLVSQRS